MRLPGPLHERVNTDGERHPLENALAFLSVGLGSASVVSLLPGWYDVALWTGLAGALIAAADEFIVKTSGELWVIFTGFGLSLVGLVTAIALGGLF